MIYNSNKKYRLLNVEDNPGDYALIEEHLSSISFIGEIDHATSFSELEDFIQKKSKPYDAVLLDLKLPDKEGVELIRETIKQVNPAPVIVLTGFADMSFSVRSLSLGISDYIVTDKLDPYGLWKSIHYSIERNSMYKKLRESEKIDLQEKILESALQAEEQERNRVARELHDGIVQQLAACGMFTQNLMDEINNPDVLEGKISRLYELLQKTTLHTRDLSHNLQSAEFDVMPLSDLLRQLVRQLTSTSSIEFSLIDHLPDAFDISVKIKVNLYRVVQELCVNIIKHSGATRTDIIVELAGEYLSLSIIMMEKPSILNTRYPMVQV